MTRTSNLQLLRGEFSQLPNLTRSPNLNFEIRSLEFSTAITVQAVYSDSVSVCTCAHNLRWN